MSDLEHGYCEDHEYHYRGECPFCDTSVGLQVDGEHVVEVEDFSIDVDRDTDLEPLFGVGDDEPLDHVNSEYEGSFEVEITEENIDTWLPFFTTPRTAGECQTSDTSVEERHRRLEDAITEPLSRAYERGVIDGLFLATLVYAFHGGSVGECQPTDSE